MRISVCLHEDAHSVGFEVSDNGPGFEVSTAMGGGGLQHMRDRMLLLGGRLSIVSQPGGLGGDRRLGCHITGVNRPLPRSPEAVA